MYVLARFESYSVYQVILDERKLMTMLTCINVASQSIQGFYIFYGKCIRRKYIQLCKDGARMTMPNKAWMTTCLFSSWMDYYILALKTQSDISTSSPSLLIIGGHISHITLNIVCKAREIVH